LVVLVSYSPATDTVHWFIGRRQASFAYELTKIAKSLKEKLFAAYYKVARYDTARSKVLN